MTADAVLRFDMMRAPFARASEAALYREAIEMAAWADRRRIGLVGFAEHHATGSGFSSSPLTLAAAAAARTERIRVVVAALLLNLHEPLQLAEQIATLDLVSAGRFNATLGLGYREAEYRAFGADWDGRGRLFEERLEFLLRALRGEPIERSGVRVVVEPRPTSPLIALVSLGGNSPRAARRAGHFGLAFCPAVDDPELGRIYREASEAAGHGPGFVVYPNAPATTLLDEDPDRGWAEYGRFLLHHADTYASWAHRDRRAWAVAAGGSVEALRAEGKYRILTPEEAARALDETGSLHLAPTTAGIDPDRAWAMLELFESRVEPLLAAAGR